MLSDKTEHKTIRRSEPPLLAFGPIAGGSLQIQSFTGYNTQRSPFAFNLAYVYTKSLQFQR